ncbi:MAG: polysaccharide pyruvyl transferase CsaB [Candidatus Margulisiibacteriota bacterium]
MKILLSGYFGFNNTGDEAILASMISEFRKKDPGIQITVLSADPKPTTERFPVISVHRLDPFSIIKALIKCDVLVSGGGGLLQDSTGRFSIIYYLSIILLAKLFGKKAAVFGQGYGPVKSSFNKKLIKIVLNFADLITVRDIASKTSLESIGVDTPPLLSCADPAILLEKESFIEIVRAEGITEFDRPVAGICLRSFKDMPKDFVLRTAEALDEFIDKYAAEALFIPLKAPEDTQISVSVLSQMKNKGRVIEGDYSPGQVLSLINSFDLVIGMRLHSLIFAASGSVPALGISYDPKVRAFCDDAGLPCIDPDFSSKSFLEKSGSLWTNRSEVSLQLKEKTKLLRCKALINFEAFFEYFGMTDMINLFGVRIDNIDLKSGLEIIDKFVRSGKPHLILTPNPEIIMSARKDKKLLELLNSSDLNIPDGIGIVAAAKLLGTPLQGRLTGIDFMTSILENTRKNSCKIFLLGSAPGIAENAAKNMPDINIVGTHHGYFKDEEDEKVLALIKKARPDILFVGLGSPRQEQWIAKYYKEIGAPVNMVIGGSLDILSGNVRRAPVVFQKTGTEWLYRLAKEPKRWKRQLNLAGFAWLAIKKRLGI